MHSTGNCGGGGLLQQQYSGISDIEEEVHVRENVFGGGSGKHSEHERFSVPFLASAIAGLVCRSRIYVGPVVSLKLGAIDVIRKFYAGKHSESDDV